MQAGGDRPGTGFLGPDAPRRAGRPGFPSTRRQTPSFQGCPAAVRDVGYDDFRAELRRLAEPSSGAPGAAARLLGADRIVVVRYSVPGVLPDAVRPSADDFSRSSPRVELRVAGLIVACDTGRAGVWRLTRGTLAAGEPQRTCARRVTVSRCPASRTNKLRAPQDPAPSTRTTWLRWSP